MPNYVFGEVSDNLNDLRIFGITAKNDTIEAPYLLIKKEEKIIREEVDFKLINQSKKGNDYFFLAVECWGGCSEDEQHKTFIYFMAL